jgi:hypothetical protein
LKVAVWPAVIVAEVDPPVWRPIEKSTPDPTREIGNVFGALSEIDRVAGPIVPVAPGVNEMFTMQELFGSTLVPVAQVVPLAIAKLLAEVPPIEGVVVTFKEALPLFVSVMDCIDLVVATI